MEVGKENIRMVVLRTEKEIKAVRSRKQRMEEEEAEVYMEYRSKKLSQQEYVRFKMEQEDNRRELEKQEKELEDKQKELEKTKEKYLRAVSSLLKLKKGEELTTELVDALVEKIYLYPGKRIEVQFRYVNEMLEGVVG